MPVAVKAVSNCKTTVFIRVYSPEMGLAGKNLLCVFFCGEYLSETHGD
jgi:hypothetical protein